MFKSHSVDRVLRRRVDPQFDLKRRAVQAAAPSRVKPAGPRHEVLTDERVTTVYPQWFNGMLREALEEILCSESTPYIDTLRAYRLFNRVLGVAINVGIFDTTGLDIQRTSDDKPKGIKIEYRKVLHATCTEDKRHAHHAVTIWFPKDQNFGLKTKGDCSAIEDQEFVIASRVVAKRRAEGMDTLDAAQRRRGTLEVNSNPKVGWEFEQEDLKDEQGWQVQTNSAGRKMYFAPDGTRCASMHPRGEKIRCSCQK